MLNVISFLAAPIALAVTANDLSSRKACSTIAQLPSADSGPIGFVESSSNAAANPMVMAKDSLYTYNPTTNSWTGIKVNSGKLLRFKLDITN